MLRGNLQLPPGKLRSIGIKRLAIFDRKIESHAAGNPYMPDAGKRRYGTHQIHTLTLVNLKEPADTGVHTAFSAAAFVLRQRTHGLPHIRARASNIAYGTGPARHFPFLCERSGGNRFCLIDYGRARTRTDAPSLVQCQRTKRTPAATTSMGRDAGTNRLPGGNFFRIRWVRQPSVWQGVKPIHLRFRKRRRGRVNHERALAARLKQDAAAGVYLFFHGKRGRHEQGRRFAHFFYRRQADERSRGESFFRLADLPQAVSPA